METEAALPQALIDISSKPRIMNTKQCFPDILEVPLHNLL